MSNIRQARFGSTLRDTVLETKDHISLVSSSPAKKFQIRQDIDGVEVYSLLLAIHEAPLMVDIRLSQNNRRCEHSGVVRI